MITPMEIQNHKFSQRWRGIDAAEVKHFLYAVAEEFEELSEQNHKMAQELAILRERVKDMEGRDKLMKDTLVTVQQIKKDINDNAEKEAELIIKDAQLKADSLFEAARAEVEKTRLQLIDIRRTRNDILAEAEMMVSRFNHFVEAERANAEESDKLQAFPKMRSKGPASSEADGPQPRPLRDATKPIRKVTGLEALNNLAQHK